MSFPNFRRIVLIGSYPTDNLVSCLLNLYYNRACLKASSYLTDLSVKCNMKFKLPWQRTNPDESKQWPQYLAVLTASISSVALGVYNSWTSPALPILLSDDFPVNITSDEASYITIIGPIGDFLGAPLAAWFAEAFGRKNGILLIALPTFVAWMIIAFAKSTLEFCIGRFISGIGDGMLFIVFPMYVGEVTEPKIRGVLGCTLSVSLIIGILAINCYAPFLSIRDSSLISAVFPILLVVLFYWMPESPYYLLMKGKIEEAKKSLYFLRRCNIEEEMQTLKSDVERQMSERGTFKELFYIDSNRKALFITLGVRTIQQMSGISAFGLLTQTVFIQAGGDISPIVSTLIYLFTQLIMTTTGSFLIDKYGRRPLLIVSCLGSGIALTIGGGYFYLKEMTDVDTTPISWLPILVMVSFIIIYGIGLGTVPSLMLGEMFSASIKGKALCIMCIYYSALISATAKLFYFLTDTYGMFASFFVFGGLCFVSIIFCYYFVPETKGKSLEDIQQYLKGNKSNNIKENAK